MAGRPRDRTGGGRDWAHPGLVRQAVANQFVQCIATQFGGDEHDSDSEAHEREEGECHAETSAPTSASTFIRSPCAGAHLAVMVHRGYDRI